MPSSTKTEVSSELKVSVMGNDFERGNECFLVEFRANVCLHKIVGHELVPYNARFFWLLVHETDHANLFLLKCC